MRRRCEPKGAGWREGENEGKRKEEGEKIAWSLLSHRTGQSAGWLAESRRSWRSARNWEWPRVAFTSTAHTTIGVHRVEHVQGCSGGIEKHAIVWTFGIFGGFLFCRSELHGDGQRLCRTHRWPVEFMSKLRYLFTDWLPSVKSSESRCCGTVTSPPPPSTWPTPPTPLPLPSSILTHLFLTPSISPPRGVVWCVALDQRFSSVLRWSWTLFARRILCSPSQSPLLFSCMGSLLVCWPLSRAKFVAWALLFPSRQWRALVVNKFSLAGQSVQGYNTCVIWQPTFKCAQRVSLSPLAQLRDLSLPWRRSRFRCLVAFTSKWINNSGFDQRCSAKLSFPPLISNSVTITGDWWWLFEMGGHYFSDWFCQLSISYIY